MERVHRGVAALEAAEVLEWEDLVREEWVAPEPVQVRLENACVRNAKRLLLMKQERRATL
jgi:hypothetical protein